MSENKKYREIRQLWFAATEYMKLAGRLKEECPDFLDNTVEHFAKKYESGYPECENVKKTTLMVAHLASAAARLYAINDNPEGEIFERNPSIDNVPTHGFLRSTSTHDEHKKINSGLQEKFGKKKISELFDGMKEEVMIFKAELKARGLDIPEYA